MTWPRSARHLKRGGTGGTAALRRPHERRIRLFLESIGSVSCRRGSRSLEQKTTILWKCLYLLASLKDSRGLGWAYKTNRSGGEANPVHGRNTTLNADKIRGFRPPYVG